MDARRDIDISFTYVLPGDDGSWKNESDLGYTYIDNHIYHKGKLVGTNGKIRIPPQSARWIEPIKHRSQMGIYRSINHNYTRDINQDDLKQDCENIHPSATNIRIPFHSNLYNLINSSNNYRIPLPKNITSIDFTKLFEMYPDNDIANKQLGKLFESLPKHIENINTTNGNILGLHYKGEHNKDIQVPDVRLKKLLIHLPFSVKTITVPHDNGSPITINLEQYRNDNYYPNSYRDLSDSARDRCAHYKTQLFYQARAILSDYVKRDSFWPGLTLFFSHNRHHVDAVNACLEHADHHQNFDFLFMAVQKIKNDSIRKGEFNPEGSLARRINYIQHLYEQALKREEVIRENNFKYNY